MGELYRWPGEGVADLRDGLTPADVVEALYAPVALRVDNRVPVVAPTLLVLCAPTDAQRLIVVVCTRADSDEVWTIVGAREAGMSERAMWRKCTS